MAKRTGKRVALYLPDALVDHVEASREWRSASEYIRNLIAADMASKSAMKPAAKPAKAKHEAHRPTMADVWPVMLAIDPDEGYWAKAQEPYDEDGFIDFLLGNAVFAERWAKEKPA